MRSMLIARTCTQVGWIMLVVSGVRASTLNAFSSQSTCDTRHVAIEAAKVDAEFPDFSQAFRREDLDRPFHDIHSGRLLRWTAYSVVTSSDTEDGGRRMTLPIVKATVLVDETSCAAHVLDGGPDPLRSWNTMMDDAGVVFREGELDLVFFTFLEISGVRASVVVSSSEASCHVRAGLEQRYLPRDAVRLHRRWLASSRRVLREVAPMASMPRPDGATVVVHRIVDARLLREIYLVRPRGTIEKLSSEPLGADSHRGAPRADRSPRVGRDGGSRREPSVACARQVASRSAVVLAKRSSSPRAVYRCGAMRSTRPGHEGQGMTGTSIPRAHSASCSESM